LKNITVREAALALGLTKRAIMYRLADGKLKGVRVNNENGVSEWRIYPTKEIIDALNRAAAANPTTEPVNPEIDDIIDAEDADLVEDLESLENAQAWDERRKEQMKAIAEEFIRPLVDRFDAQSRALALKEREIDELKIKLLPDLEKRAEDERKAAEAKELELIAMRKQIDAVREVEEQKQAAIKTENQALKGQVHDIEQRAEQERRTNEAELERLGADLRLKEEALKEAEAVKEKVVELETKVPDLESKLAQECADRAKLEEEKQALQSALDAKNTKSWWQKLFSSPEPE
jgi:chromosome segregation ATPase